MALNPPIAVDGGLARPNPWEVADFIDQVAATATITIGGTVTENDTITLTIGHPNLEEPVEIELTSLELSTTTTLATALKNAINGDTDLQDIGMTANSTGAVVTATMPAGPLGNLTTIDYELSEDATETISGSFGGGAGYITPERDYPLQVGGATINLKHGVPIQVDYFTMKAIVEAGCLFT